MSQDELFLPTVEELASSKGEYTTSPLEADDYVAKIAKVTLSKKASRNQATSSYNGPLQLKYEIIFLPYKPKAEDKILSIDGKEVAPLTRWIFKEVNPFALGMQKSGEMAYMRAILTYGQKVAAGEKVVLPGIIVLDSKDNICSEEITKEYKDAFHRLNKGEIKPEEFELRNRGYKHIADIRPLEGNYIGIKLSSDDKGNKITSFGKTPSSFVTDATVESGAMTKFAEGYQKMLDKRAGNVSSEESSANISIEDTVSVPDDELPF